MSEVVIKKQKNYAIGAEILHVVRHNFLVGLVACTVLFLIVAYPLNSYSGQATISWEPPTSNTDGSPLTDLAGYMIYYGTASGNYSQTIDVGNVTSSPVSNLTDGTIYYFAVTAYDTSGLESDYSNEVSKTTLGAQQYTLSIAKSGTGSGTVTSSAGGINCSASCATAYTPGSVVTLTATPSAGSTFTGWSGGGCTGTGTCSLSMSSDIMVTVAFSVNADAAAAINTPAIAVNPTSYSFRNTKVTGSSSKTFKISNAGKANLTVLKVVITGTDASMFITSFLGTKTLIPSKYFYQAVKFKPQSKGLRNAVLQITSNDPKTPVISIPLSGTSK